MIVMNEEMNFGISWEVLSKASNFYYGTVILIIDDEVFPKHLYFDQTINVVFGNMKKSISDPCWTEGSDFKDLGNIAVTNKRLSLGEIPNIISIELADVGNCYSGYEQYGGIALKLGFCGEYERLFYSYDNATTFKEIKLKRGSIQKVIHSLPNEEALERMLNAQKPYFTYQF